MSNIVVSPNVQAWLLARERHQAARPHGDDVIRSAAREAVLAWAKLNRTERETAFQVVMMMKRGDWKAP